MITLDPLGIYDSDQTARLALGHDVVWLYRHRRTLHAQGFPHPVSPTGHPRWCGADLIAWIQRDKRARAPFPDTNVVDYSALLQARADALASGTGARRPRRS